MVTKFIVAYKFSNLDIEDWKEYFGSDDLTLAKEVADSAFEFNKNYILVAVFRNKIAWYDYRPFHFLDRADHSKDPIQNMAARQLVNCASSTVL